MWTGEINEYKELSQLIHIRLLDFSTEKQTRVIQESFQISIRESSIRYGLHNKGN